MDDLTKKILAEADNLDAYLMDDVETLFLDQNTLNLIDWDADDWQDKLRAEMSPIERYGLKQHTFFLNEFLTGLVFFVKKSRVF